MWYMLDALILARTGLYLAILNFRFLYYSLSFTMFHNSLLDIDL